MQMMVQTRKRKRRKPKKLTRWQLMRSLHLFLKDACSLIINWQLLMEPLPHMKVFWQYCDCWSREARSSSQKNGWTLHLPVNPSFQSWMLVCLILLSKSLWPTLATIWFPILGFSLARCPPQLSALKLFQELHKECKHPDWERKLLTTIVTEHRTTEKLTPLAVSVSEEDSIKLWGDKFVQLLYV